MQIHRSTPKPPSRGIPFAGPFVDYEKKRTASLVPTVFFAEQDLRNIERAMMKMEGVGITINSFRDLKRPMPGGGSDEADDQYRSFMGLARLWHVVKDIISIAYMEKLVQGKLVLKDRQGRLYRLVPLGEQEEVKEWLPPADLPPEEVLDDDPRG